LSEASETTGIEHNHANSKSQAIETTSRDSRPQNAACDVMGA
jgi:hypothetical protein